MEKRVWPSEGVAPNGGRENSEKREMKKEWENKQKVNLCVLFKFLNDILERWIKISGVTYFSNINTYLFFIITINYGLKGGPMCKVGLIHIEYHWLGTSTIDSTTILFVVGRLKEYYTID